MFYIFFFVNKFKFVFEGFWVFFLYRRENKSKKQFKIGIFEFGEIKVFGV